MTPTEPTTDDPDSTDPLRDPRWVEQDEYPDVTGLIATFNADTTLSFDAGLMVRGDSDSDGREAQPRVTLALRTPDLKIPVELTLAQAEQLQARLDAEIEVAEAQAKILNEHRD